MASRELRTVVPDSPLRDTQQALNHLVDRDNGDGSGRLWLVADDDGKQKSPIFGTLTASNTYRAQVRSGGANHLAALLSATAAKAPPSPTNAVLLVQDAGVSVGAGKLLRLYATAGTNNATLVAGTNGDATLAGTGTAAGTLNATTLAATSVVAGTIGPSAAQQHTLPAVASDTIVLRAAVQTLTNKTLTAPVIATIVNTGTLTLPTSTDTLVGRATTDTLTNKTLTSPTVSGTVTASGTVALSGTFTAPAVTPPVADGQLTAGSLVKGFAFCSIAAGVLTVQNSQNVASVVRNSAGDYTVTWSRAFASTVYGTLATVENGTLLIARVNSRIAASVDIHVVTTAGVKTDPTAFTFASFGTLS